jgi:hypothetical protein
MYCCLLQQVEDTDGGSVTLAPGEQCLQVCKIVKQYTIIKDAAALCVRSC